MATSILRWFGGKAILSKWISQYIPSGDLYCEPYCGSAALFFYKKYAPVSVLNDTNGDVVNLFRVLQSDEQAQKLIRLLEYTPYSRAEFARALEIRKSNETDPVLRAWAFFVSQKQGFSGSAVSVGNWGFSCIKNKPVEFMRCIDRLAVYVDALRSAYIENMDALDCIRRYDAEGTVFYVDPPYHIDTRTKSEDAYRAFTTQDLDALFDVLLNVSGSVVMSGYHHDVYNRLLELGWMHYTKETVAHSSPKRNSTGGCKPKRTESLYLNPACQKKLDVQMKINGL